MSRQVIEVDDSSSPKHKRKSVPHRLTLSDQSKRKVVMEESDNKGIIDDEVKKREEEEEEELEETGEGDYYQEEGDEGNR